MDSNFVYDDLSFPLLRLDTDPFLLLSIIGNIEPLRRLLIYKYIN